MDLQFAATDQTDFAELTGHDCGVGSASAAGGKDSGSHSKSGDVLSRCVTPHQSHGFLAGR
jgi:hypothetical protein